MADLTYVVPKTRVPGVDRPIIGGSRAVKAVILLPEGQKLEDPGVREAVQANPQDYVVILKPGRRAEKQVKRMLDGKGTTASQALINKLVAKFEALLDAVKTFLGVNVEAGANAEAPAAAKAKDALLLSSPLTKETLNLLHDAKHSRKLDFLTGKAHQDLDDVVHGRVVWTYEQAEAFLDTAKKNARKPQDRQAVQDILNSAAFVTAHKNTAAQVLHPTTEKKGKQNLRAEAEAARDAEAASDTPVRASSAAKVLASSPISEQDSKFVVQVLEQAARAAQNGNERSLLQGIALDPRPSYANTYLLLQDVVNNPALSAGNRTRINNLLRTEPFQAARAQVHPQQVIDELIGGKYSRRAQETFREALGSPALSAPVAYEAIRAAILSPKTDKRWKPELQATLKLPMFEGPRNNRIRQNAEARAAAATPRSAADVQADIDRLRARYFLGIILFASTADKEQLKDLQEEQKAAEANQAASAAPAEAASAAPPAPPAPPNNGGDDANAAAPAEAPAAPEQTDAQRKQERLVYRNRGLGKKLEGIRLAEGHVISPQAPRALVQQGEALQRFVDRLIPTTQGDQRSGGVDTSDLINNGPVGRLHEEATALLEQQRALQENLRRYMAGSADVTGEQLQTEIAAFARGQAGLLGSLHHANQRNADGHSVFDSYYQRNQGGALAFTDSALQRFLVASTETLEGRRQALRLYTSPKL